MPVKHRARIQIDDLVRLRIPGQVQISPDGRRVVYVERLASLEQNRYFHRLVVADAVTGATQVLTAGEHSDTSPCWTPDSRAIVFVSDRDSQDNLWRIGADGGKPERLTDLEGRVRAPRLSPNGRTVAFLHAPRTAAQRTLEAGRHYAGPQTRRLTQLSYKHDGLGFVDGAWMHLWLLDLGSGRTRRLSSGACHDSQHAWSPNSRQLAFVSNRIPRADLHVRTSDIFVVAVAGGRPRQLTRARGPKYAPAWSPDGRHIAYVGHHSWPDTVENLHVWVVPSRGGRVQDLLSAADLMCANLVIGDLREIDEDGTHPPAWAADGKRVFFLASRAGSVDVFEVPVAGGTPVARTHGQHEIAELSQSADGKRWALLRFDATHPGEVLVLDVGRTARAQARPGRTARLGPGLGAAVLCSTRLGTGAQTPREFRIRSQDGHDIHGWTLYARGSARRAPAVLLVHGGPYAMYGWTFFHEIQMLAAAGYHVFYANIRGSAGYGREFLRALAGRWGFADFRDLTTVADWVESRPWVARDRIGIAGVAYGGTLTNWTIGHTGRFRCAVSTQSVTDFVSMYGTSSLGWSLQPEFEAPPWDAHERYWRTSPLAFAPHMRTPLLLLHADADDRCPVSQAEELFVALQVLGRDVELVRFAGEGHALLKSGRPHNRLERLRCVLDWFERKL
jgi:dipeptidyl aminopeptidase/acylaminoacyl peptidase